MKAFFCIVFVCAAQTATAQTFTWQMVVNPCGSGSGTCYIRSSLGAPPVKGAALLGYLTNHGQFDTSMHPVSLAEDSIQGACFTPAMGSAYITPTYSNGFVTYGFTYTPKYEDTSIVDFTATSASMPYSQHVRLIGITYIAASNQYSLSRSDFGLLAPGDTTQAMLRLFNQTPDTEVVTFSLRDGVDFAFLDSVTLPIVLPPGDSLPPLRLRYLANPLRPIVKDSLRLSFQRTRGGADYHSPITFGIGLTGGCNSKYYYLDRTDFGYIATEDSSVGYLTLFNPTPDSESVLISFVSHPDFTASRGMVSPIVVPPHDSTDFIEVVMRTSINRKVIRDTLVLTCQWGSGVAEVGKAEFRIHLHGGCSDMQFSIDSIQYPVYAQVGTSIIDSVIVHNLSKDTLVLHGGDLNHNYFYSRFSLYDLVIPPFQTVTDGIIFQPNKAGLWSARQSYAEVYDSSRFDIGWVALQGIAIESQVDPRDEVPNSLIVYPNPSTGEFRLQGMGRSESFKVYDMLGNHIFRPWNGEGIWDGRDDLGRPCPSGQYILAVETENGPRTFLIRLIR